ncbi:MAG: transposase domain-containing protein [Pirellulales bacterium]
MSLIQTCEMDDINPFNYLQELHRRTPRAALNPEARLPWNYRETLANETAQAMQMAV